MQEKANQELRNKIKDSKVTHWKIADSMGISESTLVRLLRKELPNDKKKEIIKILKTLTSRKE